MVSSSVSLAHLTNLEVVSCDGLKTLMPRSVAKSLVRLKIMKVIKCQSMVKIVESEEENAREVVTIFTRLEVLELVSLKKLNCFSKGGKGSVIEFPFLEKLVVSACPKMEFFCEEVNSAPVLKKIFLEHEKENIWCWGQNLNTTIEEIFREKVRPYQVFDYL
jgi:predicted methyltransferase